MKGNTKWEGAKLWECSTTIGLLSLPKQDPSHGILFFPMFQKWLDKHTGPGKKDHVFAEHLNLAMRLHPKI